MLERIVSALNLTGTETVVEIGPGRGVLTELLAERCGKLILVEIDRALAQMLRERYSGNPKVTVIESDVLKISLGEVAGEGYTLAGNVPYYITTPILFHALTAPLPRTAVFLIQKEVAERIIAKPGMKEYGALSVNLQILTKPEMLLIVPPGAFYPPPKVDSAVIRVTPLPDAIPSEPFQSFVISAFGMRRKQIQRVLKSLHSNIAVDDLLASLNIDPTARPETLSPDQFVQLFRAISKGKG